jgi:hypothetical protein
MLEQRLLRLHTHGYCPLRHLCQYILFALQTGPLSILGFELRVLGFELQRVTQNL